MQQTPVTQDLTPAQYQRRCTRLRARLELALAGYQRGALTHTQIVSLLARARSRLLRCPAGRRPENRARTRQLLTQINHLCAAFWSRGARRMRIRQHSITGWVDGFTDASVSRLGSGLGGYLQRGRHRLVQFSIATVRTTAHEAERAAIDHLLRTAWALGVRRLRLHTDNQDCTFLARYWYDCFDALEILWIPRKYNTEADRLARAASIPYGLPAPRAPRDPAAPRKKIRFSLAGILSERAAPEPAPGQGPDSLYPISASKEPA